MGFNFKSMKSTPVKGGSGKMVGKQSAGPKKPGAMVNTGGGGKFAKGGGSGKMAKFSGVKPQKKC